MGSNCSLEITFLLLFFWQGIVGAEYEALALLRDRIVRAKDHALSWIVSSRYRVIST